MTTVNRRNRKPSYLLLTVAFTAGVISNTPTWGVKPELEVRTSSVAAHPGMPYVVEYLVRWDGDPGAVHIAPPTLPAVEGLTLTPTRTHARSADGRNEIVQEVTVFASKVGEYEIPEVEIGFYTPEAPNQPEELAAEALPPDPSAYPTLRSDPLILVVRPDRTLLWIAGGLGALLFCAFAGASLYYKRRKRPRAGSPARAFSYEAMNAALHRARQHRLDGRFYDYFRDLADTVDALPRNETTSDLAARLRAHAEEVGFKGVRPNDDDLDGALRDVERAVAQVRRQIHDERHHPHDGVA